jgi:hypothetical protein
LARVTSDRGTPIFRITSDKTGTSMISFGMALLLFR